MLQNYRLYLHFRNVKKIFSFALLLWLTPTIYAQNLVPNYSIETANCPTSYNGFPIGLESMIPDWYSVTCTSPDAFTSCSNNAWTQVPNNLFGNQTARTGTNYLGFGMYGGWYDYVGAKLNCPLIAGNSYHVSFWLSRCDNARYAADEIGLYLSSNNTKMTCGFGNTVLSYTPQIKNTSGIYLTDQTGWTEVSGNYIATGGEEYITIGYFKAWNVADFSDGGAGYSMPRSVYYLDDISITGVGNCPLSINEDIQNEDQLNTVSEKIRYLYVFEEKALLFFNIRELRNISMHDMNGKVLELTKISEQKYEIPEEIKGLYILTIRTDNEMIRKKIFLQ
jgi:hypothetical protein